MRSYSDIAPSFRAKGFSLVELMVGLTIGFITVVVILQSLSVFESHKRTTTAAVDAQENGLMALMAIESDLRRAAVGFNHPAFLSCRGFFSYFQATSGTGTPATVPSLTSIPVLIADGTPADTITVTTGMRITGAAPTQISADMRTAPSSSPDHLEIDVDRSYEFNGEPADADDPPADIIVAVNPNNGNCSLMRVSSRSGSTLTITNGPAGKTNEYNAPISYMTSNNWPGFGTRAAQNYGLGSLVFRVGSVDVGGMRSATYAVDANNSLQITTRVTGAAAPATPPVIASEIVALQAQYGVSNSPASKDITAWVNPSGATWGPSALAAGTATSVTNLQRIKAIRIALVARSSRRDGAAVTAACTDNQVTNYGPCAWTDDSAASPAPVIDLRAAAGDTEWQHYRYRVYQTVIPMRNLLWPEL